MKAVIFTQHGEVLRYTDVAEQKQRGHEGWGTQNSHPLQKAQRMGHPPS